MVQEAKCLLFWAVAAAGVSLPLYAVLLVFARLERCQWVIGALALLCLTALALLLAARHLLTLPSQWMVAQHILSDFQQEDPSPSDEIQAPEQALAKQMLRTQTEIAALQRQINPHFLYNTLETIRGKALLHEEDELADMIETLARLFRYNISQQEERASLQEELENVRDCIAIYNYRFADKFRLDEQCELSNEEIAAYALPVLTLQPLVENAIRHGLEPKMGPGTVTIRCYRTQTQLLLQIRDDGVGMSPESLRELRHKLRLAVVPQRRRGERSSGIALVNVHRRLQLMYGAQYEIEVRSSPGVGTMVELTLPLTQQEDDE